MTNCQVRSVEADEFIDLLRRSGLTRRGLAGRLGLSPESISRWRVPPLYALAYLRLAVRVRELAGEV